MAQEDGNMKKLTLSLLISLSVNTAILGWMFVPYRMHAVATKKTTDKKTLDRYGHEYNPEEHDEPYERSIDTFFYYFKKASKMIAGAAIAGGAAWKIFTTFFR